MRKVFSFLALVFVMSSCFSSKQIGALNIVGTRNIDASVEYEQLSTHTGTSKKEMKQYCAQTIEGAVDNLVKSVPGGEYLMNAKIYEVSGGYAATGDVYGVSENANINGFREGDIVLFNKNSLSRKYTKGKILTLQDNITCLVEVADDEGNKEQIEVEYSDLTKM